MAQIFNFSINYYQVLDEQSQLVNELPEFAKSSEELISLYRAMVLTRVFDKKAITLQRTGKLGTYPSILGQEAASVAIGSAMKPEDVLCPYYREQGGQFVRGVGMHHILTYWGGDERGSDFSGTPASEDFPICVPIATQCLHATGVATAFKLRKQKRVAVTSIGDGGTSEGAFYEALNVAGAWKLPVVFVVVNNQWAISVPRDKQTAAPTLAQKAIAAGFEGLQVDGNDVIATRAAISNAVEKARNTHEPTLIEAMTFRLGDHTTVDDAKRYRNQDSVKQAWEVEPIARLQRYLVEQHDWNDDKENALQVECRMKVEQAVEQYLNMPAQPPESIFDYLYAVLPDAYLEQRDELLEVQHGK